MERLYTFNDVLEAMKAHGTPHSPKWASYTGWAIDIHQIAVKKKDSIRHLPRFPGATILSAISVAYENGPRIDEIITLEVPNYSKPLSMETSINEDWRRGSHYLGSSRIPGFASFDEYRRLLDFIRASLPSAHKK